MARGREGPPTIGGGKDGSAREEDKGGCHALNPTIDRLSDMHVYSLGQGLKVLYHLNIHKH